MDPLPSVASLLPPSSTGCARKHDETMALASWTRRYQDLRRDDPYQHNIRDARPLKQVPKHEKHAPRGFAFTMESAITQSLPLYLPSREDPSTPTLDSNYTWSSQEQATTDAQVSLRSKKSGSRTENPSYQSQEPSDSEPMPLTCRNLAQSTMRHRYEDSHPRWQQCLATGSQVGGSCL